MKHLLTLTLICGLILSITPCKAQGLKYMWHHNHDFDGNSTSANDVIATEYEELYVLYTHSAEIDVDPTPAVIVTDEFTTNYTIVKYNDQREYLWYKTLPAGQGVFTINMKQGPNGNIYVYGFFGMAFDADPGPGVNTLTPSGFQQSGYIIQLDSNANYINAVEFDATSAARIRDLDIDDTGNLYVIGVHGGDFDADPGAGVQTILAGPSGGGAFMIKLNPNMQYIWSFGINGPAGDNFGDIVLHGTNIYVSGSSPNFADVDPGPATVMSTGPVYLLKYDTAANLLDTAFWASGDLPLIAVDDNGLIMMAGTFMGSAYDADPNAGSFIIPSSNWWEKPHLIALDYNFNFQWAIGFETTSSTPNLRLTGVAIDPNGNVVTAGHFKGGIDLDPSVGTNSITSLNNSSDGYVGYYDNNGNMLSGHGLLDNNNTSMATLKLGPDYEVFIPLNYRSGIDVDPGPGVFNVTNSSTTAALVIEYSSCPTNVTVVNPSICEDDVYAIGDTAFAKTGTHRYRFKTTSGCDSIVEVNLTVSKPAIKMKQASDTLEVEYSAAATYQWHNCTMGMDVSGETNSTFIPTNNDAYAVAVTEGGCIDTSGCVQYLQGGVVGVPELVWGADLDDVRMGEHNNLITDKYGNFYLCGTLCSRSDVSLMSDSIFYQEAGNSCDIIVAKYNNNGKLLWGYHVGSAGPSNVNEYAASLAVDDAGNVYIAGDIIIDIDFNPNPDLELLVTDPSPGCCTPHAFIAKLNESGQIQWAKGIGSGGNTSVWSMDVSPAGRIAITGEVTGTADMDPGVGVVNTVSGAYVAIYDNSGNFENLINIPIGPFAADDSFGHSVSFNSQDALVISGSSSEVFDFDLGPGTTQLTPGGAQEYIYLAQYDFNMNLDWATRFGDYANSIYPRTVLRHDCNDKLYFAGQGILNTGYSTAPYVIRYDANGNFEHSYSLNSTSHWSSDNVAIDVDIYGNLFVTGKAMGGDFFSPGVTLSGSNEQTFVAKYQADGTAAWVFGIEDDPGVIQAGIAADHLGNVFLGSDGHASLFDIDPSAATYNLNSFFGYVAKYGEGCGGINTGITLGTTTIDVPGNGYYVWKRCNDNVIVDTTLNTSFAPTVPGDYYAVIYAGNCVDSTGCITILTVGIEAISNGVVNVYPNPAKDHIIIETDGSENTIATLYNMVGKQVATLPFNNRIKVDLNNHPKGVYLLEIKSDTTKRMIKVIKQ